MAEPRLRDDPRFKGRLSAPLLDHLTRPFTAPLAGSSLNELRANYAAHRDGVRSLVQYDAARAKGCVLMPQSNVVVATVDDDRRVRESVQNVLESAGYEAVSFESAETFLLSGVLSSVSCVIADVRLPGMDGTELQRRIRGERPPLPVILITAHDDDDVRRQALRDGAVAFLVKPFDGGDLLEHVGRATNYS